jgi:hypothetical protein
VDVVSRRSDRAVVAIRDDFDQARCTDRYIDVDNKATEDGDGGSVPTSSAAPEFWGAPGGTTAPAPALAPALAPAPVPALAALAAPAGPTISLSAQGTSSSVQITFLVFGECAETQPFLRRRPTRPHTPSGNVECPVDWTHPVLHSTLLSWRGSIGGLT